MRPGSYMLLIIPLGGTLFCTLDMSYMVSFSRLPFPFSQCTNMHDYLKNYDILNVSAEN